jgi:hypothetical protein
MNDTVTQLWSIAQHHPDGMCKKQALSQLQGETLRAHYMLQKWEQDAQRAAQAHAQTSAYVSPEIQESFAHPQELLDDYEAQVLIPQQYPVQSHEPLHNYPEQLSSHASFHVQPQQPQHGLSLEQPPLPIQIGETSATPRNPHLIKRKLKENIDAGMPNYIAASRLISMLPTNASLKAEQDKARGWQENFKAQFPPEGQQYLGDILAKIDANRQAASQQVQIAQHQVAPTQQKDQASQFQHLAQQSQFPPPSQFEALQNHIRTNLPKFLNALRIVQAPIDPGNLEAAAQQQLAHDWMRRFKATLPPQGHQIMDEIVGNMMRAKGEGRDWLGEMGK